MRGLKTLVAVAATAGVVAASALATTGTRAAPPACTGGQYANVGGCLVDPWPKDPSKFSAIVAKAAFSHDYGTIWRYLHPSLQQAVSETKWQACQKRYPLSSAGVKIKSVKVADSKPVPIVLPVLGKAKIRAVTLQVLFTSPATSGVQAALEYAYWLQSKGKWSAVWLPELYGTYKSGKCDTAQPRSLY